MGQGAADDQLAALKQLDETWTVLHNLVQTGAMAPVVLPADERRYPKVLKEAQILYGRLANVLGRASMEHPGGRFDAFQHVLGQPNISRIVRGLRGDLELWEQLWTLAASAIAQAIGRLEAQTASGAKPAPEQYIGPRSQFDAYVTLKEILDAAAHSVTVVDPYTDDATLRPLLTLGTGVQVRLLTVKPSKDFAHAVERFREQWGGNIEARKGIKQLHDRFLLVDGRVFFSGASFKDLGQRGSMIDEIRSEAVKDAVKKDVEASWKEAEPIT